MLLWDVDALDDGPKGAVAGSLSNIFSVAFSSDDSTLYAAGNDGLLLAYSVETTLSPTSHPTAHGTARLSETRSTSMRGPLMTITDHDGAILRVSPSPTNPKLAITACDDAGVRLYDLRASEDAIARLQNDRPFSDCALSPTDANLFATAARGEVLLHDMRSSLVAGKQNDELPRDLAVKSVRHCTERCSRFSTPVSSPNLRKDRSSLDQARLRCRSIRLARC